MEGWPDYKEPGVVWHTSSIRILARWIPEVEIPRRAKLNLPEGCLKCQSVHIAVYFDVVAACMCNKHVDGNSKNSHTTHSIISLNINTSHSQRPPGPVRGLQSFGFQPLSPPGEASGQPLAIAPVGQKRTVSGVEQQPR